MLPLLLVLGLFLFLTFVGQAVISLVRPRLGVLRSWFLAPTAGLAVLLVIVTRLNVWGIPVRTCGPWLTLGLFAASAAILVWRRPILPWRQLLPFVAIVLLYLPYIGWPALRFGFKWISYGNDDMTNYCLAADRFLDHGYYQLPLQTELEGRNYSQHYWFMHALQQIRPGSELTIAWVASITGLRTYQAFMPTIIVLSALQIFAMAALALYRGRYRKVALLAVFLLATSPLFALGSLYQLIAQVAGITLMVAAIALLLSVRSLTWRELLFGGLITAGLAIAYPEVSPFVPCSGLLFGLRLRYRDPALFKRYCLFIGGVAALTFLLIATNTYEFINTLVMQAVGASGFGAMAEINDQSGGLVLFPWTLVPSYIPMLFGLHPFGWVGIYPLLSIQIAVGIAFLGYFVWRIARNTRDDAPVGYLGVVVLLCGVYFFAKGLDFQLFKLAMYAQPIIAICLAQGFAPFLLSGSALVRRRARWILAGFFVCTAGSYWYYTDASLGTYGGGLTEVVDGSRDGVGFTMPKDLNFGGIESDISNVVSAKLLAFHTQGIDTRFLSRSYMDNVANIAVLKFFHTHNPDLGPQARLVEKLALLRFLLPNVLTKEDMRDVPDYRVMPIRALDNDWAETSSRHLDYGDRLFISMRTDLDHFNKANQWAASLGDPGAGWTVQNMYQYKLEDQVRDRLVFIHSELSPHYYSAARFKAAFFQREPEPITGGKVYFHGTGRYNLFKILGPSPDLRVMVDFTRTSLGAERSFLPRHAIVRGDEDYPLPFVGSGSARVVTSIIRPEMFEKEAYITIDFGEPALPIPTPKHGLMRLYGLRYNLDDRRLVGFTRDISVLTDEEYRALPRPTRIGDFPADLSRYPGLEYSGLFEDGWVAADAYFKLGASHPGQVLSFKGFIPDTPEFRGAGVDLLVSINDQPTEIVNLKSGDFDLRRLIREPAPITSISLHFSAAETYNSSNDLRPVSAFVRQIAIEDRPNLAEFRRMAAGESGAQFGMKGVDSDGWMAPAVDIAAPALGRFQVLKIDLEMPGWAPLAENTIKVLVDGRTVETDVVPRATYRSLYLPLEPGAQRIVHLESSSTFPIPGGQRLRSFAIKNISLENLSRSDLFTHGWHRSGYLFTVDRADSDGWVDRRIAFKFPATTRFGSALIDVVRFPSRADFPLTAAVEGGAAETRRLGLETPERIRVPLSPSHDTAVELSAPLDFPLAPPDTRVRSFRIVGIDFK